MWRAVVWRTVLFSNPAAVVASCSQRLGFWRRSQGLETLVREADQL